MSDPVIIVGAPRSGTNMLRDVLAELPGIGTWDCDEINLIWKHGNVSVPHDELTVEHARPEVARYLRSTFDRFQRRHGLDTVLEKTCATSLRVAFTAAALPNARFIFIRRDGMDATASAMQRWNAPFDLRYTLKKARYVPARDFPIHFAAFASKRLKQRSAGGENAASGARKVETWWGPRPHDYKDLQARHALDEIAFIQWQRCVDLARDQLEELPRERWHEVAYEDFVRAPVTELERIVDFLGRPEIMDPAATQGVRPDSVGKGRARLGPESVERLERLGRPTLARFGYA